jgi:hypothetical protein
MIIDCSSSKLLVEAQRNRKYLGYRIYLWSMECYKLFLMKCSNHGVSNTTQIHVFRNRLQQQHKLFLGAIVDGLLMYKKVVAAMHIIECSRCYTYHRMLGSWMYKNAVAAISSSWKNITNQNFFGQTSL